MGLLLLFCSRCGCDLPTVAKYCVRCGLRVAPLSSVDSAQAFPSPTVAEPPGDIPQSSNRAQFLDAEVPAARAYANGDRFVVPPNAVLPSLCVKCGGVPDEPWLKKTFSWHSPYLYFLLISPLLYVIVALIVQKRVKLVVPLCATHKSIRRKRIWMASVLLLGCIPIPAALAAYLGNDEAAVIAAFLGLAMFVGGLIFHACCSPLSARRIGPGSAEFSGACEEFLARLG